MMGNLKRLINTLNSDDDWRTDALTDKINNHSIDTCFCPDVQKWETGIEREGKWYIVVEYPTKEDAIKGHKAWCEKIRKNSSLELKECRDAVEWFFGD